MASVVQICNLALSNLGDGARVTAIDPSDGSVQANLCAVFYPVARDALFERYPWSFANARAALVLDTTIADPLDSWEFSYVVPTDCLRVIGVHAEADSADRTPQDFVREGGYLFTNTEDAVIRYTKQVTLATSYPALFVVALARLLSSYLAGPLLKGMEGVKVGQAMLTQFEKLDFPLAAAKDANGQKNNSYGDFTPDSIAARA